MPYHILTTSIFPNKPQSIQLYLQAARDGSSDVTQLRGVCFPLGNSELHGKASAEQLNSAGRGQLTPTGEDLSPREASAGAAGSDPAARSRTPSRVRPGSSRRSRFAAPPASPRCRDVRSFHFEPQVARRWEKVAVREPGCRSPGRGGSSCWGLAPVITFLWSDAAEQSWALPCVLRWGPGIQRAANLGKLSPKFGDGSARSQTRTACLKVSQQCS